MCFKKVDVYYSIHTIYIYQLYRVSSTCLWSWLGSKAFKKRKSKELGWNKQNNPCHAFHAKKPVPNQSCPAMTKVTTGQLGWKITSFLPSISWPMIHQPLIEKCVQWNAPLFVPAFAEDIMGKALRSTSRLDTFSEASGFPPQDCGRSVVMLYL